MSGGTAGLVGGTVARARGLASRTGVAVRLAATVPDARLVLVGAGLAYLAAYLVAIGHLRPGTGAVGLVVVADPLARATETLGFLAFEPVALVDLAAVRLLVAPVNLGLGAALAALVGVNLAVSYLAWRHPAACGIAARNRTGLLAGLPALLSGAACCGPVVLLATFRLLVPLAAVLLVGSLLYVGRSVDPTVAGRARRT